MDSPERVISLDTETTGLSHAEGDRIVEIGAVEIVGNMETGRTFHAFCNPYPKPVSEEAFKVHGLSTSFLMEKPKFREHSRAFLEFIGDSPLVIHNAPFDMGFLNAELAKVGRPPLANEVRDTLRIARLKYPGQRSTLDALCSRLDVDNSGRDLHGALIDASLLAQVYVKLQELDRLALPTQEPALESPVPDFVASVARRPRARRATFLPRPEELAAHLAFLASSVKDSLWTNPG